MMASHDGTCTNVTCEKEATHQVRLAGVTRETYGYCDEHYHELQELECAEIGGEL